MLQMSPDHSLACVEVGGNDVQTVLFDGSAPLRILAGAVRPDGVDLAVAVPGIIAEGRVVAASNLDWYDVDPVERLGLGSPALVVCNDAGAAAIGEAALRDAAAPPDLLYIGLGTGVGGAVVRDAAVVAENLLGHGDNFGEARCRCGDRGCLETIAGGWALPTPLGRDDVSRVSAALARAVRTEPLAETIELVVVGGGLARAYPSIVAELANHLPPRRVEASRSPAQAKSAAAWGLRHLTDRITHA